MIKIATLLTAAVLLVAGSAQASTIDVLLGGSSGTFSYTSANTLSPNVNLTNVNNLTLSGAGVLSSNLSIPGFASAPTGSIYDGSYLFVAGGGTATFSLGSNGQTFGLTWGSIDSYNTLTLTDSTNHVYTITGSELQSYLTTVSPGSTQANVSLSDPLGKIIKVVLTSSSPAFEAANFATSVSRSVVPLPASAVLFALALAGLALFGRRLGSKAI